MGLHPDSAVGLIASDWTHGFGLFLRLLVCKMWIIIAFGSDLLKQLNDSFSFFMLFFFSSQFTTFLEHCFSPFKQSSPEIAGGLIHV